MEAALSLCEPGTTFVAEPGHSVTGTEAISEVICGFLTMKPTPKIEVPLVNQSGDTALLHAK